MQFNPNVVKISQYPSSQLVAKKKAMIAAGKTVYDFGQGDPIEPTAEFIRAAVGPGVPEVSQYPTVRGVPELRKAAAGYVKRRFGVALDAETEIIQCTGSKEAIFTFTFLFANTGGAKNLVIGPSPGYFVMERSALIAGLEYLPFELSDANKYLLELETLSEEVLQRTALVWINYPHNPTGVSCDVAYLERQVAVAKKYGIVIASDECYVDLFFGKALPPSILQVTRDGVVAFHSCSKRSGMTAYRTGFLAGDRDILQMFAGFRDNVGVATPVYTQAAAVAAWSDDRHPEDRRRAFAAKRAVFEEFFAKKGIEYAHNDATFYYWLKVPAGETDRSYTDKLLELGIVVGPGSNFGAFGGDRVRVALVPSLLDCRKAIELWSKL